MYAKDQLVVREQAVLEKIKNHILAHSEQLHTFAQYIARLDVYTSHAIFAQEKRWSMPEFADTVGIQIKEGRHPVIEKYLPIDQHFIPNDMDIGNEKAGVIHIITGPNMGGKSTFLRQNALIVLLAHCGLFVPAEHARIGLVDGIFARVGSGDVIAKNQSTFMTEMLEVSHILHNATDRSFIIFDELGRGTSTYDGLALTKAIISHIADTVHAQTLLATHYHELIGMEQTKSCIKNFSVSVYETETEVVFMKKIVPGGADKSYGIDVAKLAGIPPMIIQAAQDFLLQLEEKKSDQKPRTDTGLFGTPTTTRDPRYDKIKTMLDS